MNKRKTALCAAALFVLQIVPVFAQLNPKDEGWGMDDRGRSIAAVLPLATSAGTGPADADAQMAARFHAEIMDAVEALEKYSPRTVPDSVFPGGEEELPTDMPPHRDLVPNAKYALTGGVYPGNRTGEYYLQLWLWEMTNSTMIYTDDLVYTDIDEAMFSVPGLVEWLFSHIHELIVETPVIVLPRDPFITLGVRFGPSQRWYTNPDEKAPGAWALNIEGGISGMVRLNSILALQLEALFAADNLVYRGLDPNYDNTYTLANKKYTSYTLTFPLLFKMNFRPGKIRFSPMAGFYAAAPLGKVRYRKSNEDDSNAEYPWSFSVPIGIIVGLEGAVNYGPGSVFAGLRYAGDLGNVIIKEDSGDLVYRRDMFTVYLGYEFEFKDLNKK
jgi:hypothetical protein